MKFLELCYKHMPFSLEKLYERAMENIIAAPVANVLDFISCLLHN